MKKIKRILSVCCVMVVAFLSVGATPASAAETAETSGYLYKNNKRTNISTHVIVDADDHLFHDDVHVTLTCAKPVRMLIRVRMNYTDSNGNVKEIVEEKHVTTNTTKTTFMVEAPNNDANWVRVYCICNREEYGFFDTVLTAKY